MSNITNIYSIEKCLYKTNVQIFQALFSYHFLIETENGLKRQPLFILSFALTKSVVLLRGCDFSLFL